MLVRYATSDFAHTAISQREGQAYCRRHGTISLRQEIQHIWSYHAMVPYAVATQPAAPPPPPPRVVSSVKRAVAPNSLAGRSEQLLNTPVLHVMLTLAATVTSLFFLHAACNFKSFEKICLLRSV